MAVKTGKTSTTTKSTNTTNTNETNKTRKTRKTDESKLVVMHIDGPFPLKGEVRGKGEITIQLGDATKMDMSLTTKPDGRLLLGLGAATVIGLSADSSLRFKGGLTHDLMNRDLIGTFVGVRLEIGSKVTAEITQTFKATTGNTTSVNLRVKL